VAFDENSKIRDIIADERAKAILDKHFPGASTHPQLSMGLGMTLKQVSWYPESGMTKEKLGALVEDLAALD
jgi:beta-glucosidase